MRWRPGRRSENLEDRRESTGGGRGRMRFPSLGRAGVRLPGGRGPRLGIGGLALLLLVFWFLGGDPLALLGGALDGAGTQVGLPDGMPGGSGTTFPGDGGLPPVGSVPSASPEEEQLVDFVSFVLDDLQATWARTLGGYRDAKLVLFRDEVDSGCGFAAAQMGPFYCPVDQKVYIDLAFFEELKQRFGAPGDFAQAYVIAHEIGHHIQRISGIEPRVRREQEAQPGRANDLSVRMELQADCLAGVWGHSTARRELLDAGDVEEGLGAAAAIGDDRLQRMSRGRVQPESFTHGSSQQRVAWLRRGLEEGDPEGCDTFSIARP